MRIKKINKKGFSLISEADAILFWFIVVIVVALCAIFSVMMATSLRDIYVNANLEPIAYDARLMYSPLCFSYTDHVTQRSYSGTIDPNKFSDEVIRQCLPMQGTSNVAIAAELKAQNGAIVNFVSTSNWNLNVQQVKVTTYIVNIQGVGPGILTIYHKEGK